MKNHMTDHIKNAFLSCVTFTNSTNVYKMIITPAYVMVLTNAFFDMHFEQYIKMYMCL